MSDVDLSKYNFSMAGACYPEGHYESKSLDEDIHNLKYHIKVKQPRRPEANGAVFL